MNLVNDAIDCGTWREYHPMKFTLPYRRRPSIDGASIAGGLGRARGLLGGAFMGTLLAQQSKTYTARDYVQDGLIGMWDGIENAGWGAHTSSLSKWVDLTGLSLDLPAYNNVSNITGYIEFKDNCAEWVGTKKTSGYVPSFGKDGNPTITNILQLEACYDFAPSTTQQTVCGFYGSRIQINTKGNGTIYTGFCSEAGTENSHSGSYMVGTGPISVSIKVVSYPVVFSNGINIPRTAIGNYNGQSRNGIGVSGWTDNYIEPGSKVYCVRIYNRALTAAEITHNYAVDKARFGLP